MFGGELKLLADEKERCRAIRSREVVVRFVDGEAHVGTRHASGGRQKYRNNQGNHRQAAHGVLLSGAVRSGGVHAPCQMMRKRPAGRLIAGRGAPFSGQDSKMGGDGGRFASHRSAASAGGRHQGYCPGARRVGPLDHLPAHLAEHVRAGHRRGHARVGHAIILEASASFLGLGVQPPHASWGNILNEGKDAIEIGWWLSAYPGVAILVTVLSYNLLGEGIRDALDPRLRQSAGRIVSRAR